MRRSIEQHDPLGTLVRPWASDRFVIIWVDLAHAPDHSFVPYVADRSASVWRLRRALSDLMQCHETELLMSNYNSPLNLSALIQDIMGSPIIVRLARHVQDPQLVSRYRINWPSGA